MRISATLLWFCVTLASVSLTQLFACLSFLITEQDGEGREPICSSEHNVLFVHDILHGMILGIEKQAFTLVEQIQVLLMPPSKILRSFLLI